jgi:hypothetical protein
MIRNLHEVTACDIMEEQSPQARRPSAWGMLGPVSGLLGGETSPAAF